MSAAAKDIAAPEPIAAYDPFRSQIDQLQEAEKKAAFDYATPAGNRAARSHVHALRKVKAAIDKARKGEKADILERGRQVDGQAKELIAQVEAMIEPHVTELARIEEAEAERVAELQARVAWFDEQTVAVDEDGEHHGSNYLRDRLGQVRDVIIDADIWQEFSDQALSAQLAAIDKLETMVALAEKREAEAAELARLREEQDRREAEERARAEREEAERLAREQKEREERAAREAAERAKQEAEEDAERERREAEERLEQQRREHEEAMRRERDEAERRIREEREAAERKAAAEQAERDRLERERLEEEARQRAADEARQRDQEHRRTVNREVVAALVAGTDLDESQAQNVVRLIASDDVPYVQINY